MPEKVFSSSGAKNNSSGRFVDFITIRDKLMVVFLMFLTIELTQYYFPSLFLPGRGGKEKTSEKENEK